MKKYDKESPWHVGHAAMAVQNEQGMKICDIRGWGFLTGTGHGACALPPAKAKAIQVQHANRIAAANDMLDALREALPFINDAESNMPNGYELFAIRKVINQINAAIAKAESKSEGE